MKCVVDFGALPVQGDFYEEYPEKLVPISSVTVDDELEEQRWIGVDSAQADGPVYMLYGSAESEQIYESLDAFLRDLE